jgi:hypothetical protein
MSLDSRVTRPGVGLLNRLDVRTCATLLHEQKWPSLLVEIVDGASSIHSAFPSGKGVSQCANMNPMRALWLALAALSRPVR